MWGTIAVFLTVLAALAPHQAAAGAYCQPTLSAGVRCKNDGPWRATSVKTTLLPTSAVQVCYTLDSRRRASRACKRMSWDAVQVPMSIPCFNSSAINATLGGKPLAVSWDLPKTSGAFCEGNVAHATFSKRSSETYTAADKQLCYTLPPVVSRGSAVCSDVQPDGTRNLWFLSSKKSRCCPGTVLKDVIDRGADSCPAEEGDLVFVSPGDKGGNITRFPGGSTGLVTQTNRVLKPVVTIPVNASDNAGRFFVQVANFSYQTEPRQAFYKELVDVDPHGMSWYRFRQMWTDQCWQAVGDTPGNILILSNCSDSEPLQRFYVAPTAYDTASLVNTLYTIQPRSGLCVTVEWPSNTSIPAPLTLQECKPTSPDTTQSFYIYATIRRTHCTPYPSTCADIGSYLLSLNPAPSGSSSDTKCLPLVRTPFASSTFVSGDCLYNSIDTIQVEYTNYGSSRCKVKSATYGGIPMEITQDQYTHGQSSVEVTYNGGDKLPTGPGLSLCLTFEPGCASQVQLSGTTVLDPKRHCCNRGGAWLNNYFPIPFPSSFPVGGYWEGYCQVKAARDNGQLTCSGQQEMLTQTAQLLVEQKGAGLQLTSTLQLLGDQDCQLPDNCQALCLSSANCELPKGCDSRLTGVQQGPVTVTYNSTNSTSGNAVIGYQNGNDIGIFSVTSGALVSFLMPPSVTVLVQAGIVNADPDTLSNFKTDAAGTLSGLLSGSAGLSCKSGGSGDVSYAYKCQYWQVADVDAVGLPFYQKLRGCPSTTTVPPTKPAGK